MKTPRPFTCTWCSDKADMSAEERAELEAAIEEGAEDFKRGEFDNAREFALRLAAEA